MQTAEQALTDHTEIRRFAGLCSRGHHFTHRPTHSEHGRKPLGPLPYASTPAGTATATSTRTMAKALISVQDSFCACTSPVNKARRYTYSPSQRARRHLHSMVEADTDRSFRLDAEIEAGYFCHWQIRAEQSGSAWIATIPESSAGTDLTLN